MRNAPSNLWLDDLRLPPDDSWLWVKTVDEATAALTMFSFEKISLDHDLGWDQEKYVAYCDSHPGCSGNDAIAAAENPRGSVLIDFMIEHDIWPSQKPRVHSANIYGKQQMERAIDKYWHPPLESG